MNIDTNDDVRDFSGLSHKEFRNLLKESCDRIVRMMETLTVLELEGSLLSEVFCSEYDSLLRERIRMLIRLHIYYCDMERNSFWFMRPLVRRRVERIGKMHKKALFELITLRNYMRLHDFR